MTYTAAALLGVLGAVLADLVVLRKPLREACAKDVLLVIAGGAPRVADPALGPALSRLIPDAEQKTSGPVVRWTAEAALGSPLT